MITGYTNRYLETYFGRNEVDQCCNVIIASNNFPKDRDSMSIESRKLETYRLKKDRTYHSNHGVRKAINLIQFFQLN